MAQAKTCYWTVRSTLSLNNFTTLQMLISVRRAHVTSSHQVLNHIYSPEFTEYISYKNGSLKFSIWVLKTFSKCCASQYWCAFPAFCHFEAALYASNTQRLLGRFLQVHSTRHPYNKSTNKLNTTAQKHIQQQFAAATTTRIIATITTTGGTFRRNL